MQPLPLTKSELAAVLARQVAEAQATGIHRDQAIALVCRRLGANPQKVAALLDAPPPSA